MTTGNALLITIILPIIAGLMVFGLRRRVFGISIFISLVNLVISFLVFLNGGLKWNMDLYELGIGLGLRSGNLSSLALLAVAFFTFIVILYSHKFMERHERLSEYYGNILVTLGVASGVVLSTDLVMLLVFWGISGLTLYNLINIGGPKASEAAKKTFIILGATDALMIFGIAIVWFLTGTFAMDFIKLPLNGALPIIAYFTLLSGALAKAGAIPFHTWIPDSAEAAPVTVMAYLPASLDKILGIYLLARISLDLFVVVPNSLISLVLLIIGSITVVIAVLAALVQHNLKKLLSFHAVSQVGYMVMGIGTGIPVGIAGGLFHMINHAIYKCCLFLGGGSVEKHAGTAELDKLGGLGRVMPITFITMFIAALSISGIPPFNGFVSKWMIYQGVIALAKEGPGVWMIWLAAAMFGSALTLASFVKLINATFLGRIKESVSRASEAPSSMLWPMGILAALCVVFGVFAFPLPLQYFILPIIPFTFFSGSWSPVLASILIIIGLALGFGVYYIGRVRPSRVSPVFTGGELLSDEKLKVSGVRFYDTIKNLDVIKQFYEESEARAYDMYEQLKRFTFWMSDFFKWMHNGLLHTYLAWCLLGLVILLFVFFQGSLKW